LREASIATETGKGPSRKAELPNIDELKAAFPHLEILELIGQGGMGFVYKARQPKLDRFVALKILPQSLASDPTFTERFTREGRVLAKLNHPNIVGVHDFGQANGFFYLLMEFVTGVNLRQAMEAGRFTPAQALALVPEICEALQYAHMQAILHRDIKPENILLDTNGRVKIADFGIAKLLGEPKLEAALTGTGSAIGTPQYMAPEQIEHPAAVDHRADIYSLGVVLYELLTGELPLGNFPPPSEKTPVNPGVDAVVLRALEKQREKRYQSAQDVKTGVQGLGTGERNWTDDEWVLSCLTCGKTGSLRKAGGVRISAASIGKRTLIHCSQCNRIRWAAIVKGGDVPYIPIERKFARRLLLTLAIVFLALLGSFGLSALIYFLVGQAASKKVATAPPPARTKTIELTGATNQKHGQPSYFSIGAYSRLLPDERFHATFQFHDGRIQAAGLYEGVRRGVDPKKSSLQFSWRLPQEIGADQLAVATSSLQQWEGKPVSLTAGQPIRLFSVTNTSGEQLSALLEFLVETPPPANSTIVASVRVTSTQVSTSYWPTVGYHGRVAAGLEAAIPTAHVLDCIGFTLAGLEERTLISYTQDQRHRILGCEWNFPTTFTTNDHHEAARQLTGAAFVLKPRERKNVFSVTNAAGDVMRGYLELVPPQ
jgi:tRNA A-37 threonylcarbamoyl transferase component Bud32